MFKKTPLGHFLRTFRKSIFEKILLYQIGLVIDILSLVLTQFYGVIPTRGWLLSDEFMESEHYLKVICRRIVIS